MTNTIVFPEEFKSLWTGKRLNRKAANEEIAFVRSNLHILQNEVISKGAYPEVQDFSTLFRREGE